jgi:hypothetical protein
MGPVKKNKVLLFTFILSFQCFAGRTDGLTSSDFKNRMEEFNILEVRKGGKHPDVNPRNAAQFTEGVYKGKIVRPKSSLIHDGYELWMLDPENPEKDHIRLTRYNETHGAVDSYSPVVLTEGIYKGKIVYSTDRSRRNKFELWMLDPENPEKDHIQLTRYYDENHFGIGDYGPVYIAEGTHAGKIVYSSTRLEHAESLCFGLWMLDLEDTEGAPVQLTKCNQTHGNVSSYSPVPLTEGIHKGKIVYKTDRSRKDKFELWMLDPENPENAPIQLTRYDETHDDVNSIEPVQLTTGIHKGKIVYKTDRSRKDKFELWMLDLETMESVPLIDNEGSVYYYNEHGLYLGFISDVLPLKKEALFVNDLKGKVDSFSSFDWQDEFDGVDPEILYKTSNSHLSTRENSGDESEYLQKEYDRYLRQRDYIVSASNFLSIAFSLEMLLENFNSEIVQEEVLPLIRDDIEKVRSRFQAASLSSLVATPLQVEIVQSAIEALKQSGDFPKRAVAEAMLKIIAQARVSQEIDYQRLSQELGEELLKVPGLISNPRSRPLGIVIESFVARWSQE